MSTPTSPKRPTPADPNDLRTAIEELAKHYESVNGVVSLDLRALLAAYPAPTPGEDHLDAACAWSDFRKDYGVSGDDKVRRREHRAFMAGWQSARGTIDAGGVQR